jgi:hypothetical protein
MVNLPANHAWARRTSTKVARAQRLTIVARKEVLTAADFIRTFREGLVNAMDSGKDIWQVLDDMEESVARSERFRARRDGETEA